MVRGFRLVVNGVCARVGECRYARSIVAVFLVAVGERHGSAVYALSRRDDRCDLFLAGVIHAGCFHGNDQLRQFDLDGHSSGRGRVFLIALRRGECPFGIIAACIGLDCAVCPCKCTVDCITRVGVFHLARNFALAQRVAVGDLACSDFAVRRGLDLVYRVEDERQLKVLVVSGGDRHFDGTDPAGHFSIFRIELCQNQLAFFKLYDRLVVIIPTLRNKGNISLTIAYRAIFALGQSGQYIIEVIGVRLTCAVDYVQCVGRDIRGRSGFVNFERLIIQLRAVQRKVLLSRAVFKDIALILQLDGKGDGLFLGAGIGGIIAGVGHLIICTLSQPKRSTSIIAVRALKCDFRICRQVCRSVVCLNDVADRSRYFERSDIPLGRLTSGIIALVCCLDGQRTGAYIVGASAAGDDEIHIFFQLCAFVCHDKRRHTGRGRIVKGRFIAIGECDLGIAEIRLGDGQLPFGALHRVAVLGGGEINAVFSNRVTR